MPSDVLPRKAADKSGWTVGHALARQAQARGTAPFFQVQDGAPVSYGEADRLANRVARGAIAGGVRPGDRVAVMLPNGAEILLAWFGLSRAGAVTVFVNTAYKGIFLEHVLNNAGAEALILHQDYVPMLAESLGAVPKLKRVYIVGDGPGGSGAQPGAGALPGSGAPPGAGALPGSGVQRSAGESAGAGALPPLGTLQVARWDALLDASDAPVAVPVSYRDIGAIMYTSGTTGPSKGVLMPHAHLYLFGQEEARWLRLTPADVYYICMPLFHANALFMQLYGTLIGGARCVIVPGFSASRWLDDVARYGATVTNTLGVMTEFIFRQPPRPEDRKHKLRLVLAVPTPAEIGQAFMERFGTQVIEGYGMTEINIPVHGRIQDPYVPGASGRINTDWFELKIVDPESDEELAVGQMGEIVVRPKEPYAFMAGYNAMADKTVEAWRNFWFHTGDAGRIDPAGNVYFMDRIRDTIRRRGENLSSYEIEKVLAEHAAVAEVAAIAVPSAVAGREDEVKVCIVPRPGPPPRPEDLLDWCVKRMPYFAVPRYVEFVTALPKTPTQKVQKNKLREQGLTPGTWDREQAGYRVRRGP